MNVLIVEDEPPAARRLARLTKAQLGARLDTIEHAETVAEARIALARTRFDLVLLDLDLNGADGFEILRDMPSPLRIVVVSARVDRAIHAFDNAVVDFVPKPVGEARLARALERATRSAPPAAGQTLVVRATGRLELVAVADIVAVSGADDYVEILLSGGRRVLHDARLDDLERRLPSGFVRVHRSHIVKAEQVKAIHGTPTGGRTLQLASGQEIPVSRSRTKEIDAVIRAAGGEI
jgi:two-component system response regulator LytT